VFLVEPETQERVARALEAAGTKVLNARVAPRGVEVVKRAANAPRKPRKGAS